MAVGGFMTAVKPEDVVRLTRDLPHLFLHRGAIGVVKSTWCSEAYEVEFDAGDCAGAIRALVFGEQIELTAGNESHADTGA
jgi:hypothetical protein